MIDKLFNEGVQAFGNLFGLSGDNAMQQAINNLFAQPVPDLSIDSFQEVYSITWALGIALGLVFGGIASIGYLGRNRDGIGTVLPFTERLFFAAKVFIVGILTMPATGLALWGFDIATHGVSILPGADAENTWLTSMTEILVGFAPGDILMSLVMNALTWFAAYGLTWGTALLTLTVFPILFMTPVFYAVSIMGKVGLLLWRMWLGLLIMTISAKTVIAWVLGAGNWAITIMDRLSLATIESGEAILAACTLVVAALTPIVLLIIYGKGLAPRVQPAVVTGRSVSRGNEGSSLGSTALSLTSAGLGALAARQSAGQAGDISINSPGHRRIQASGALSKGAMTLIGKSHPATAIITMGGSLLVGASGTAAQKKSAAIQAGPSPKPLSSGSGVDPYIPPTPPPPVAPSASSGPPAPPSPSGIVTDHIVDTPPTTRPPEGGD